MFELCREAAVLGDDRPAVGFEFYLLFAGIHHGLNGKAHPRPQLCPGARLTIVEHLRILMEFTSDTVPAIFTHDGVVVALDMGLDGVPDIAQAASRSDLLDTDPERLLGDFDQPFGQDGGLSDAEHLTGIAMEAILDDGNVNVDDIPFFQPLLAGYTVADNLVDRGADRPGKTAVVERRGDGVLFIDNVVVTYFVQFEGGDPRLNMGGDHLQYLCRQFSGDAHFCDLSCSFYCDTHLKMFENPGN